MTGGAGNDVFLSRSSLIASNRDRITDFNVVNDTVCIDNAVFTKLTGVNVSLSSAQFFKGSAAHDTRDRIIYNSTNGALLYDADGNTAGGVAAVQSGSVRDAECGSCHHAQRLLHRLAPFRQDDYRGAHFWCGPLDSRSKAMVLQRRRAATLPFPIEAAYGRRRQSACAP